MQPWFLVGLVRNLLLFFITATICVAETEPFQTKDFVNKIFADTLEPTASIIPKPINSSPSIVPMPLSTAGRIEPFPSLSDGDRHIFHGKPIVSVYLATSFKPAVNSVIEEAIQLRKKGVEISLALVGSPAIMANPDIATGLLSFEASGGRYQVILEIPSEVLEQLQDKTPARSPLWLLQFGDNKKLILNGVVSIVTRFNDEGQYYENSAT